MSHSSNHVLRATTAISNTMAYISGLLFLLLAIYMTIDVLLRFIGAPYSGISDSVASVTLALGGTWALARGLSDGSHVRVDVAMPFFAASVKRILYVWSMAMLVCVAGVLAWQAFRITTKSMTLGATLPQSIVAIPIAWPQGLTAIGYSMLCLQGLVMLVSSILIWRLGNTNIDVQPIAHLPTESAV